MPEWLTVVLLALTVYRATRLVTCDSFPPALRLRSFIVNRGPEWLGDLVTCPWCASVWLSAAITATTQLFISVPAPVLVSAAATVFAGLLGQRDSCADLIQPPPNPGTFKFRLSPPGSGTTSTK